jgi:[acyl-carrier-protein] S-malonyltransferase
MVLGGMEESMTEQNTIAYVFPGQGSQKTGMGRDLFDKFNDVKAVFQEADNVLGFPLSKLCFEGPEDELRQTINAQPALVTMSIACLRAAQAMSGNAGGAGPAYLAGDSLGEYTALTVAGVLDFPTTVYLARERGRLMQEAGQKVNGAMAAIIGLDEPAIVNICQETGVWLANVNCPGQLVISGAKENIEKAIALAQSRGAARAMLLQVSGAFHTPLMQPAADGMTTIISRLSFKNPAIPIIANASAKPLITAEDIKSELLTQLCHSVQWQRSIEYMIQCGVTTFIEIGAGRVLTGLIKRINKGIKILNIGETAELTNIAG